MSTPADTTVTPDHDDIAVNAPAARWGVQEEAWAELAPELPAEVAALVAPPVTVSAR